MNLEVGCGVEKSISKPNSLLYLMEWVVHGTGIVPTEKATEKRKSYSFWLYYIAHVIGLYTSSIWILIILLDYAGNIHNLDFVCVFYKWASILYNMFL